MVFSRAHMDAGEMSDDAGVPAAEDEGVSTSSSIRRPQGLDSEASTFVVWGDVFVCCRVCRLVLCSAAAYTEELWCRHRDGRRHRRRQLAGGLQ